MGQQTEYLYQYENGERIRNVGFVKIQGQMDKRTLEVYGKELDEVKGILFQNQAGEKYVASWEVYEMPVEAQEIEEDYVVDSSSVFEKIQRQELSRLPRKDWRIANNSFLLHGFYNYHHLLYIEEDGKKWIGVPGIYHEKEKMAANAFGFTEFRRIQDVPITLAENEQNTYEDFGYWCRQVGIS